MGGYSVFPLLPHFTNPNSHNTQKLAGYLPSWRPAPVVHARKPSVAGGQAQ